MKIKKFNVSEEGLNHFFGPLEARIMEIMWSSKEIGIKDVHSVINQDTPISFNAVMTVMNRLHDKGHLKKNGSGKGRGRIAYYAPMQSKEQFLIEQTKAVTDGLILEFGDLVVTHMIDALEDADPELIHRLEQKLNQMKKRE
ncbi:BlaI/MecI/CopY family transcriptional regulator [Paenibacillus alginolyticus]|uniref:BlaI/MecI/CopY family transcriptional regulator n=1 Tax=Paenibacillus alginolyticus TaxID=59839 RepID=A0ABT4GB19_9BACL|nr:BlaI/MecI/CopY family transcriptional regulator [Paenibacillus alginolyticus]MCY9693388.1 BlaI/MecI/CopY family transcriptional regulator [Paenibacillus alginolyticus]MEC0144647.1 BlaI/MecI/CopY family transcriptional regulator [Paenibacillus alginolyticus]